MKQNLTSDQSSALIDYRTFVYSQVLTYRRDVQFELMDALLGMGGVISYPELSESSAFRRKWESVYSAVEDGRQRTEELFKHSAKTAPHTGICVFALDVSAWRRLDAETMEDRQYVHQGTQAINGGDVTVGYPYSWLEYVPKSHQSWTTPISVGRVPSSQTQQAYGAEQIKKLCAERSRYTDKLDIIAADGSYGNSRFLTLVKDQPCGVVVRLRKDRKLRGRPDPTNKHQTKHGATFDFKDAQTWSKPDDQIEIDSHPNYGTVRIRRWNHWHDEDDSSTEFDVLLIETHLERAKPCEPFWLAWQAPAVVTSVQASTRDIWEAYDKRGAIESSFRFRKQTLIWTMPQFSIPEAGDRWTVLVFVALQQLALARPLVEDRPRPWHTPLPLQALTPRRVQIGFANLASQIGTPARPPKTRGIPPGWPKGRPRTPHPRFDVVKKQPASNSRVKT